MWIKSEGQGRPIIFIHGWTMDHRDEVRTYEPIFERLSGWCRHYFDLPGMGLTPAKAHIRDMDGMLAACIELVESLVGDDNFLLAGTSAGAYLARGVAKHFGLRVDGLLLRAPLVNPIDAERDVDPVRPIIEDSNALKLLSEADREEVGEILVQTTSYIKSITEKVRAAVAPASELADAAFLSPIRENPKRYRLSFDPDASDVLCKGPSLIITGRHDASVGYRDAWRLVGKLPRSTYVVLDRAEHGLPIDQHDLFAALVRDWLARVSEMQL